MIYRSLSKILIVLLVFLVIIIALVSLKYAKIILSPLFKDNKERVGSFTVTKVIAFNDLNGNGVYEENEKKISNVWLSDGKNFYLTDKNGIAIIKTDAKFIFSIGSKKYSPSKNKYYVKSFNGQFYLPFLEVKSSVKFIYFTDPPYFNNLTAFQWRFIEQVNDKAYQGDVNFVVAGGDQVAIDISKDEEIKRAFSLYKAFLSQIQVPVYTVIGNHDFNRRNAKEYYGKKAFWKYLGPTYYSFSCGDFHGIVIDDYSNNYKNYKYEGSIEKEVKEFAIKDARQFCQDFTCAVFKGSQFVTDEKFFNDLIEAGVKFFFTGDSHTSEVRYPFDKKKIPLLIGSALSGAKYPSTHDISKFRPSFLYIIVKKDDLQISWVPVDGIDFVQSLIQSESKEDRRYFVNSWKYIDKLILNDDGKYLIEYRRKDPYIPIFTFFKKIDKDDELFAYTLKKDKGIYLIGKKGIDINQISLQLIPFGSRKSVVLQNGTDFIVHHFLKGKIEGFVRPYIYRRDDDQSHYVKFEGNDFGLFIFNPGKAGNVENFGYYLGVDGGNRPVIYRIGRWGDVEDIIEKNPAKCIRPSVKLVLKNQGARMIISCLNGQQLFKKIHELPESFVVGIGSIGNCVECDVSVAKVFEFKSRVKDYSVDFYKKNKGNQILFEKSDSLNPKIKDLLRYYGFSRVVNKDNGLLLIAPFYRNLITLQKGNKYLIQVNTKQICFYDLSADVVVECVKRRF